MIPLAGKSIAQSQCGGGLPARVGIIAVVLLHNALPVRYLILAPIVNLILAGLFYRVARSANLDQSGLT